MTIKPVAGVLGANPRNVGRDRILTAIDLYKQDKTRKIASLGIEGESLAEIAYRSGIPTRDILTERKKSKSTIGNLLGLRDDILPRLMHETQWSQSDLLLELISQKWHLFPRVEMDARALLPDYRRSLLEVPDSRLIWSNKENRLVSSNEMRDDIARERIVYWIDRATLMIPLSYRFGNHYQTPLLVALKLGPKRLVAYVGVPLIILGIVVEVYANDNLQPFNCPSVHSEQLISAGQLGKSSSEHFDWGIPYGGRMVRIDPLVTAYHSGVVKKIVLTGNKNEIENWFSYAVGKGIKQEDIITAEYSANTAQNVTTAFQAIRENELGSNGLHASGYKHLRRVHKDVEMLGYDPGHDDSYVGMSDGYGRWNSPLDRAREWAICVTNADLKTVK